MRGPDLGSITRAQSLVLHFSDAGSVPARACENLGTLAVRCVLTIELAQDPDDVRQARIVPVCFNNRLVRPPPGMVVVEK